jgi:hypothetical protein
VERLQAIVEAVRPHLASLGLVVTWAGIALVALRRRVNWKRKRFIEVVNFSLNYIDDGGLALRTVLETSANKVWLNEYGVKLVTAAAGKTRHDQPFILLKDPADMAFMKRALVNVLSEKVAGAYLGGVLGAPVRKADFLFALTFERFPDMRTQKFRVLLVQEQGLQKDFGPNAAELKVEEAHHIDRLGVLREMARLAREGGSVEGVEVLGRVELGVLQ